MAKRMTSRAQAGRTLKSLSRWDGMSNILTQHGTSADKRLYNVVKWDRHTPEFFEQFYAGDEIASTIVDVVPEEALRKPWEYVGIGKASAEKIDDRCKDLELRSALERTWKWSRAYGGACLYIVTDTNDPASPLILGEEVIGLRDLSRSDLRIMTTDVETDFGSPNWGRPNLYYLIVTMGSDTKNYPIHHTRMIRFDGDVVPRKTYIRNNYWHDSILNKLHNPIRNYQSANDAVATMLQDFGVDVYKMKNLSNLLASGNEAAIQARMEILQLSKSAIRAMILDADSEEYINMQRSIDGVAELLTKQANRLVAASGIPHTKLLGESPDGSNATGNSTTQQWYDSLQADQENYLRPKIKRLMDVLFPELGKLDFKFRSLYQLTELEQSDMRLKQAQTDQIYLSTGVLDPTEVAESRFGGDEYSTETKLDREARSMGLIGAGSSMGEMGGGSDLSPQMSGATNLNEQSNPLASLEAHSKQTQADPSSIQANSKQSQTDPSKLQADPQASQTNSPNANPYFMRNQEVDLPEKVKPFISMSMSEPMRDPKTDPKMKAPGKQNKSKKIAPSVGNGITAPSGKPKADMNESVFMKRQLDQSKKGKDD